MIESSDPWNCEPKSLTIDNQTYDLLYVLTDTLWIFKKRIEQNTVFSYYKNIINCILLSNYIILCTKILSI